MARFLALVLLLQLCDARQLSAVGLTVAGASSERAATELSVRSELKSMGLWVCDPSVRQMLSNSPSAAARGEIIGLCRRQYTKGACTAMENALYKGPDILRNLDYLCGPAPPSYIIHNQEIVGAGPYKPVGDHHGYGPRGKSVDVEGANVDMRTSFRGPIAPPGSTPVEMDKSVQGKSFGSKFAWESKPTYKTKANTTSMQAAANAVRVFDSAGLGAGTSPMEGYHRPISGKSRAQIIINGSNSTEISMNVSVPERVYNRSDPGGYLPIGGWPVQQAGNNVSQNPYIYSDYTADFMNSTYFDTDVNSTVTDDDIAQQVLRDMARDPEGWVEKHIKEPIRIKRQQTPDAELPGPPDEEEEAEEEEDETPVEEAPVESTSSEEKHEKPKRKRVNKAPAPVEEAPVAVSKHLSRRSKKIVKKVKKIVKTYNKHSKHKIEDQMEWKKSKTKDYLSRPHRSIGLFEEDNRHLDFNGKKVVASEEAVDSEGEEEEAADQPDTRLSPQVFQAGRLWSRAHAVTGV